MGVGRISAGRRSLPCFDWFSLRLGGLAPDGVVELLGLPRPGVFSVSLISVPMAVARFLASLHSVVLLPVGLWVSQVHQVISGSIELGWGRPPARHLQLGSLVPVSMSIRAFHLSGLHQVLHGGKSLERGQPSTWQWHILPCALVQHRGSPVFDVHLHELLFLESVTVGPLASAVFPWWFFDLGRSSVVAPWLW